MGIATTGMHHTRTMSFLEGKRFDKVLVDGILRESNMTYEDAFKR
jgi:hypothetical protein